ncbi:hypothetical protein KQX54_018371 [Cotesia glomerata]|uniref:Uncharacterized protein n=1 Tax=Cotesia glomerata TaxID=32391 RepID=A0AAV7I7J1_COTGL|nr:hypothetical protein KQX54_018371 [Cotesia glomerata]
MLRNLIHGQTTVDRLIGFTPRDLIRTHYDALNEMNRSVNDGDKSPKRIGRDSTAPSSILQLQTSLKEGEGGRNPKGNRWLDRFFFFHLKGRWLNSKLGKSPSVNLSSFLYFLETQYGRY